VVEREGRRCAWCRDDLYGARGLQWAIHHRRRRDGLPDSHEPQNLVVLCGADNASGCHGWSHQRRSESQPAGYWLSRVAAEDPLLVPILLHAERWVYLTADGSYSDAPPDAA
jgi:hypothetical protein